MTAPRIARRAVVGALLAPVALIGGWSLAAGLQPPGYSSVRDTISALAALGTPHRWVMTTGFIVLGLSHLLTASGLTSATRAGRLVLAIGGVGTLGVALFPLPAVGSSGAHVLTAGISFAALGLWPALAGGREAPGLLRRRFGVPASVVLLLLVFAFLLAPAAQTGLLERLAAGAQSLWPLVVVADALLVRRSKSTL